VNGKTATADGFGAATKGLRLCVLDVFILRTVALGSGGPWGGFFVPVIVPFTSFLTLLLQAYHVTSLNICFYCFSLSLFLTFRGLSSSTALILRFFR
jgi:hypothetical protein